ncbi:MAG TPA: type II secretion system protein GspE [Clostridiaceae bacterium]|nr:type II secretion system protein GspE [Clostridiaceae bacterium]HBF76827.1 type II secretion system protein GspE [Clostridiaceae bacterium]HBG38178.1 type II secretion system protein GspE [Clostridiaceae bacterium]HBN29545.1 type II secretion system protein GspE [Clostridiaceae bacterium]HBX48597.1 type II secretion system protein GspE [Clostridiaceae bacterium]
MNEVKLGELLIKEGKVTEKQIIDALEKQKICDKKIDEILIEDNIVKDVDIAKALQKLIGIKYSMYSFEDIDIEAAVLIPEIIAKRYDLVPVAFNGGKLVVLMKDPLNIKGIDDVNLTTGYEVEPVIGTKKNIKNLIERVFSEKRLKSAANQLIKEQDEKILESDDTMSLNDSPAVKLVDSIIKRAIGLEASDIHIEPYEKDVRIRYRINGELCDVLHIPINTYDPIVKRIKILSDMDITKKWVPQDGRMIYYINNDKIDLRISILPTVFGEKIVIRILNNALEVSDIKYTGMGEFELKLLNKILLQKNGLLLITGPTGSGKSTTMHTILKTLNSDTKNIVTIEQPVEYLTYGINQVNVNNNSGIDFSTGLRAILRQDPDIIMIGEIRDSETAEIAARSAITGHLVLSTLHTTDSSSAIIRLIDMGIPSYMVSACLSGIIAQRLVKTICPYCKKEYPSSEYERNMLNNVNENSILYSGIGCKYCNYTGYKGRTGIFEIMTINNEIRNYINSGMDSEYIKQKSINNGMRTLKDSCINLVLNGITSFDEMMKVMYFEDKGG